MGIGKKQFGKRTTWLAEPRNLPPDCVIHFQISSELFKQSRADYRLSGTAFLEAFIGFERALRLHFKDASAPLGSGSPGSGEPFKNLFSRCVESGLLPDGIFRYPTEYASRLLDPKDPAPSSHGEALSRIVPDLRNHYVHGNSLAMHELFPLALDLRAIADRLETRKLQSETKQHHHLPTTLSTSSPASRTTSFD